MGVLAIVVAVVLALCGVAVGDVARLVSYLDHWQWSLSCRCGHCRFGLKRLDRSVTVAMEVFAGVAVVGIVSAFVDGLLICLKYSIDG